MRLAPWLGLERRLMRRTVPAILALLAIGFAAVGCGGSSSNGVASKPPTQILQTALDAMKAAKSVHMAGTVVQSGKTIKVDMTLYSDGDVNGSFSENGPTVSLIKIGSNDYLRTTSDFYQSEGVSAQIAGLMANKWIEIPDSSIGLATSFSITGLANSITKNHVTVTKGKTATVDGQPVVSVVASNSGVLYVATTGTAYPVEITKGSTGTITFSQWDQGKTPAAPAGARTPASFA